MRRMPVLVAAVVVPIGLAGCGGGDQAVSSQCAGGAGGGQCVLSVTLSDGKGYDYLVAEPSMPVLAGGLRVKALVQTDPDVVRVSWKDTAGQEVAAEVKPGSPQSVEGVAEARGSGDRPGFVIHFQPAGSASIKVDATITYG